MTVAMSDHLAPGSRLDLTCGEPAAGGGFVARAPDGRIVFVRHALPGERVVATVTSVTSSYLRVDAVEVLEPSPDRVSPPCPVAGPGRCGGCDWQHVALPAQRRLKSALLDAQLRRLPGVPSGVPVVEIPGAPEGIGWRTRVRFAVDREGRLGFHRHRSHAVEPVRRCAIASPEVDALALTSLRWRGARRVEVVAPSGGGPAVVSVETRQALPDRAARIGAGLVRNGAVVEEPGHAVFEVLGHRFEVGAGVFWQVHPMAAEALANAVLASLEPRSGEVVADLYAGAGLFAVALAQAVGPTGRVVAVERGRRACADLARNTEEYGTVEIHQAPVTDALVATGIGTPDLVVLDPARAGAGTAVMRALVALDPPPRRIAYVSCDPASLARDLAAALAAGWAVVSLSAFDLFPMTEHLETVVTLAPPRGT